MLGWIANLVRDFAPIQSAGGLHIEESTLISGPEGLLDSFGLISFLMGLEKTLAAQTGRSVVLVNDAALARQPSPFLSAGTLLDYIDELLNE